MIALGVRNCHVDIVRTGEEAIKKFRNLCYDIAFMDIKLPGKNGVECLAEILDFCPDAKVVMMTGFSEATLLDKARQAGAIDILRKPFRLKEMFSYIDHIESSCPPSADR
jgi:CheY-like chemotaxis protein